MATLSCGRIGGAITACTIKVKIVVDVGRQKAARTVGTWTVTRVRKDCLLYWWLLLLLMKLLVVVVVESLRDVVVTLDGNGRTR